MSHLFRLSALGAALVCLATSAAATPVTLTGNLDGYLGAGAHSGVFDGKALLPANFQVNGASFSFRFSDDQDGFSTGAPQLVGSAAGNYGLTSSYYNGNSYIYNYLRTVTAYQQVQRSGETEQVSVSLAGTNVGSGATALSQSSSTASSAAGQNLDYQTGYNGYTYYYGCGNRSTCSGWQPGSWSYYYSDTTNQTTTLTSDWTGDFEVSGALSDLSLLDPLLNNGELLYGLFVGGDLRLIGATLTLDITELAPAGSVPEPASLALVAGAFGALAYSRRRGKKQRPVG